MSDVDFKEDWVKVGFKDASRVEGNTSNIESSIMNVIEKAKRSNDSINKDKSNLAKLQDVEIEEKEARIDQAKKSQRSPLLEKIIYTFPWIGATFALFIVYASFTYHSIFDTGKEFLESVSKTKQISALPSIIDVHAYSKAFGDTWIAGCACIAIPCLFVLAALGFHHLLSKHKYFVAFSVLGVMAFVDCLMSYKITKEIYEIKFSLGIGDKEWNNNMLLTDVNFWIMIAIGFVAYLLWGWINSLIMNMYRSDDTDEIKAMRDDLITLRSCGKKLKIEVDNMKNQNFNEIQKAGEECLTGWKQFLTAGGMTGELKRVSKMKIWIKEDRDTYSIALEK